MNRRTALLVTGSLPVVLALPAVADNGIITVYAAGSLREAFEAAGPAFTLKTGIRVMYNFAGSDVLANQIKLGAPADVFASANMIQMEVVSNAGFVSGSPAIFARNRIVLITPKSNPGHVMHLVDLIKPGTKVVLAEQSEPVGIYARTAFKKLSGNGYPANFADQVEKNVVSNEANEKAVAAKIALGEGDAGVVYSTDIIPENASQLNEIPFPSGSAPDIQYPIAALKGAKNTAAADKFVRFITTDGRPYLDARGFLAP